MLKKLGRKLKACARFVKENLKKGGNFVAALIVFCVVGVLVGVVVSGAALIFLLLWSFITGHIFVRFIIGVFIVFCAGCFVIGLPLALWGNIMYLIGNIMCLIDASKSIKQHNKTDMNDGMHKGFELEICKDLAIDLAIDLVIHLALVGILSVACATVVCEILGRQDEIWHGTFLFFVLWEIISILFFIFLIIKEKHKRKKNLKNDRNGEIYKGFALTVCKYLVIDLALVGILSVISASVICEILERQDEFWHGTFLFFVLWGIISIPFLIFLIIKEKHKREKN